MIYYQKLAAIPAFTFNEAAKIIGSKEYTSKVMNTMVRNGNIHRVRKDLYTCVNFGTGDDFASRFQIASKINQNCFISFHSAFEFYGFYNQTYFEIQVCSPKRFSEFSYGDYLYKWFPTDSMAQVQNIQGTKVVTIERAIVDSVYRLGKLIDTEELVKCLDLIHRIDENKILEMLSIYHQERLYRKIGYILSFYQKDFSISDSFFDTCKKNSVLSNKGFLINDDKTNLVFDSNWGLYAYGNLKKLSDKGGNPDV